MRTRLLKRLRRRIGRQYYIEMWAIQKSLVFYVHKKGDEGYIYRTKSICEAKSQIDSIVDNAIRSKIAVMRAEDIYGPRLFRTSLFCNRYQHLYYIRTRRGKSYRSVSRLRYELFRGNHPGLAIVEKVDGPLFFHWYG